MWPDEAQTRAWLASPDGDGDANRLWDEHREPLRRAISLRLHSALGRRVDASDVVQEVMLKASQRLVEYKANPVLPFHAWLRRIARDHLVDEYRKHRRSARRDMGRERSLDAPALAFAGRSSLDIAAQLRDPGLTPVAEALRAELRRRFHEVLAELEDDDREIILLRHIEQLSNVEAARELGLSEPAAGMRHLRALRRLRERLAGVYSHFGKAPA